MKVNVPVLGIVENMAGFTGPDGKRVDIFGEGGGERTAKAFNVPLLASIPIDVAVREGGDNGQPIAYNGQGPVAEMFRRLALQLIDILDKNLQSEPQLKVVN